MRERRRLRGPGRAAEALAREQFIADATFVPSGVAEGTRLQQREGYAYLKP